MSDHYFPWLEEQGHSGYAWSVLGGLEGSRPAEDVQHGPAVVGG